MDLFQLVDHRKGLFVKKLIFELEQGKLSKDKIKYLRGYLNYIIDVEPKFYDNLCLKYGAKFTKLLKQSSKKL